MADNKVSPTASVQEVQNEFRGIIDELQLRVKEMRDLREEAEQERAQYGEALGETNGKIEALEKRIVELQESHKDLQRSFNSPRLTTEDADRLEQDKRMKAFCKFVRHAGGVGPSLTEEERAALYPEGRSYVIQTSPNGSWDKKTPAEARALVENSTGKILAPQEFDASIIRAAAEIAIMRPLATVRPIGSHTLKYRKLTEFSVDCGEPLELGGSATESNVTPTEHYQYVEDWNGLAWFGVDELEDTDIDLLAFMQDSFARAKADKEDYYFLANGAGHATYYQPEKLLDTSTITAIEAAGSTSITVDDLMDLMYGYDDGSSTPLNPAYQRNGVFIMHPFTELAVMKLRDQSGGEGTGQYLWSPAITAGTPNTIRGHAVYTSTDMPTIEASADVAIFGDIRSTYRILDRRGMTMQRLMELKALSGQVGFLFTWRNTGGIIRSEASRILSMAAG